MRSSVVIPAVDRYLRICPCGELAWILSAYVPRSREGVRNVCSLRQAVRLRSDLAASLYPQRSFWPIDLRTVGDRGCPRCLLRPVGGGIRSSRGVPGPGGSDPVRSRLRWVRCSPRTNRIARRRPSGTRRIPERLTTEACHSGVVRMPSVRK